MATLEKKTMKAVILKEPFKVVVEEVPVPTIEREDEAIIEVYQSGLCGTFPNGQADGKAQTFTGTVDTSLSRTTLSLGMRRSAGLRRLERKSKSSNRETWW